jgi:hypothetical protein
MLGRLLLGLVLGLFVGGLIAAGLVAGLGVMTFSGTGGAVLAYLAAALAGVLTGLVAGKPIWSSGAKIEAGLKAVFGALAGAGVMFALRQWGGSLIVPSIPAIGPAIGANGVASVGDLPAVSIPLLAAVLGGFFGVDNTKDGGAGDRGTSGSVTKGRQRIAARVTEADQAKRANLANQDPGAGSRDGSASGASAHESDDEGELISRGRAKH